MVSFIRLKYTTLFLPYFMADIAPQTLASALHEMISLSVPSAWKIISCKNVLLDGLKAGMLASNFCACFLHLNWCYMYS